MRGVDLNLTRSLHACLLVRKFRFYSLYIRSGRKISAEFPPRASKAEIVLWAQENGMTRICPRACWLIFPRPDLPYFQEYEIPRSSEPNVPFRVAEWQPGGFFLAQAAITMQL